MNTFKLSFFLAFALLLCACGSKKHSGKSENKIEFTENNEENPVEIISPCLAAEEKARLEAPAIAANIIDYRQEGNCIVLNYQYSGCQKVSPHLVVIEKIYGKKSMILKLALLMGGAGECDMLISEENYFNVQNIAAEQDLSLSFNEGQLIVEFENP
jgi:hypothetical protein